jgi:hypothetical protein
MATIGKLIFSEHSSGNLKGEYIIKGHGKPLTKK